MNRFQRFLWQGFIYGFIDETGGARAEAIQYNRRSSDVVTDEQIKAKANNGQNMKELIAENTLIQAVAHEKINGKFEVMKSKLKNHDVIIWSILVVIVLAIILGAIGFMWWFPKFILERLM